ncbi:phosphatase PAP2 family protein [Streptacidiphilus jiangxiensis]|uniref:Undecaprenyl-diphosphatase n=1 Tax=Streptacidiphilus jiangxiensis TaxID=235985 RepID=A0A1H7FD87_STRJI|nr:phosphatase PAP2 family protein [Streptacidiphilus jiangxiensis]SEK22382.1 undecaprenyl-diphosphatase [Streptacidiphilus jiangxiensis]
MRHKQPWGLWAGAGACLALFGVLLGMVEAGWSSLLHLDLVVDRHLHTTALHDAAWTGSMRTVSSVLEPTVLRVALGAMVLWLWWRGARIAALWAATCGLVQGALEITVKTAVARPRPALPQPVSTATGWSFPSGHAMTAATVIPLFVVIAWPHLRLRTTRMLTAGIAGVLVLLVSWTRIGLGVHWPSDVVAGWLLAGFTLCAVTAAFDTWRPDQRAAELHRLTSRSAERVQRQQARRQSADPF